MKDQQLHKITKKYDKAIDQKIRKNSKEKRGNIEIITFSTKDSTERAITRINKTNKFNAKDMNLKPIVRYFQHKKQSKKNKECNFKTIIEDCNKKYNISVSQREVETLNETKMRQKMEEYGEVKKYE